MLSEMNTFKRPSYNEPHQEIKHEKEIKNLLEDETSCYVKQNT
jgi:hypothetical protein